MESESSKKQKKMSFESLSAEEKFVFIERARYLIDNQYIQNVDEDVLSKQLYEAKWRQS